jgi:hypothetical protein
MTLSLSLQLEARPIRRRKSATTAEVVSPILMPRHLARFNEHAPTSGPRMCQCGRSLIHAIHFTSEEYEQLAPASQAQAREW